jgi:beta-N-acetylhexosaminidase
MKRLIAVLSAFLLVIDCLASASALDVHDLSDTVLAGQVILSGLDGNGSLGAYQKMLLEKHPPGGILLFAYNLKQPKAQLKAFLASVSSLVAEHAEGSRPLMAVDQEGGVVHRFASDVRPLSAPHSYTSLAQVGSDAAESAQEIGSLGITLNLAPVAEVETPLNSAFLGSRSYGSDPVFVGQACAAFIKGFQDKGIACCIKHFPGDGAGDPHTGLITMNETKAQLEGLPIVPLLRENVPDAVMVGHALVPAVDSKNIASLSSAVMGAWLRDELGYKGLIITDDFSMDAARASGLDPVDAAVKALGAGADMVICWPKDLASLHRAILKALADKSLKRARLEDAASRVLALKAKL